MIHHGDTSPAATVKDLQGFADMVMTALQDLENRMDVRFDEMDKKFDVKMDTTIGDSESRMLLAIENLRHDMIETHKDKITQHEDRIVRMEKHLHLSA